MISHDGLNLKNSMGAELLFRRLQLMEEAVAESPEQPNYEGSRHFLGTGERAGGALMAPTLRAYVGQELSREATILKEKRKAREARGGKGKKKGEQASGGAASSGGP